MASPLQLIKKGIESGDWKAVCKGYSALTGDDIEVPDVGTSSIQMSDVIKFLSSIDTDGSDRESVYDEVEEVAPTPKTTKSKSKKTTTKPSKKKQSSDNEPLILNKLPKVPMVPGKVGGNKKMFLPAGHLYDEAEAEDNASRAIEKDYRDPHVDKFAKCFECQRKFNYTKTYPAGQLDASEEMILCEKCKDAARPNKI